jgi:hypothetical protein
MFGKDGFEPTITSLPGQEWHTNYQPLQGSGNWVRHITIREANDLRKPCLRRFIRIAIRNARQLAASTNVPAIPPQSIVKRIYARKRRPRREVRSDLPR